MCLCLCVCVCVCVCVFVCVCVCGVRLLAVCRLAVVIGSSLCAWCARFFLAFRFHVLFSMVFFPEGGRVFFS